MHPAKGGLPVMEDHDVKVRDFTPYDTSTPWYDNAFSGFVGSYSEVMPATPFIQNIANQVQFFITIEV